MFIELKNDNLSELLQPDKSYIVIYGASWCGNCSIFRPRTKILSHQYPDIDFYYVDVDKYPNSRFLVSLTNLPTTVGVKNGNVTDIHIGSKVEGVENLISKL